jgi:hypothetical protein
VRKKKPRIRVGDAVTSLVFALFFLDPLPPDLFYFFSWAWWWLLFVDPLPPDIFFDCPFCRLVHILLLTVGHVSLLSIGFLYLDDLPFLFWFELPFFSWVLGLIVTFRCFACCNFNKNKIAA